MKLTRWVRLRWGLGLLVAFRVLFDAGPAVGQALVVYPADTDILVLSYTVIIGEIAAADRGPSLRVYGDGRVEVHYPAYMTRAGDYTLQLSPAEMARLLQSMVDRGLVEFDANAAQSRKHAALSAQASDAVAGLGPVVAVSDASTIVIELHRDRYVSADGKQQALNVDKTISWYSLRADAQQHPNIPAIQELAAASQELQALLEHPDLD